MENDIDVNAAIRALNGSELNGRKLVVAAAKAS